MKTKRKTTSISTRKKNLRIFKALKLFLFVVLLDQVSKHYIEKLFPIGSSLAVIKNIFYITHTNNTGVSFGLFKGYNLIFILISLIALVFFIYLFKKNSGYWPQLSLIGGGIVGNLIDRITLGYVIDFLELKFWPIFNIADSAITLGVIWLIIASMKNKDELF